MTRQLFLIATVGFWLAVLGFWLVGGQGQESVAPPSAGQLPAAAGVQSAAEPAFTLAQVAAHGQAEDCWMAIDGAIYDITRYLPEHPSRSGIVEPWCGREASQAYRTKGRGRSHSPAADALLAGYRIGLLAAAK